MKVIKQHMSITRNKQSGNDMFITSGLFRPHIHFNHDKQIVKNQKKKNIFIIQLKYVLIL